MTLDKKLDAERKAAQIVSKDVQKYVDYAKNLETKLTEEKEKTKQLSLIKQQENTIQKVRTSYPVK